MKNIQVEPLTKDMSDLSEPIDDEGETTNVSRVETQVNDNNPTTKPKKKGLFESLRGLFFKITRMDTRESLEESVVELINEHDPEHKHIGTDEREMLSNVLGFHELKFNDVMIPRPDIVAVADDITLDDIKTLLNDKEHTRIPVYHENMDNITGFIHIKDIIPYLGTNKTFSVQSIIRKALFVPPSMKIIDLLKKMKNSRVHIALVMDEYGGTDGLVTIEDLVEEIVGEIKDEHDTLDTDEVRIIQENLIEVNARTKVTVLEKTLDMPLISDEQRDEFDTVGGLIFEIAGRVPEKSEKIKHSDDIMFEIVEADPRRVTLVRVHKNTENVKS
ncbi:MAG: hemolysin family protein [Rickettsiales bacterium]|nr:hemolysin family protein [Rickettsiales bacterium]